MQAISRDTKYVTEIKEYQILVDTTRERGGTGEFIGPHELLEAALAACINITLRKVAENKNIDLTGIDTKVILNNTDPEKAIFECSIKIKGHQLIDEKTMQILKNAANLCAVKKTLSKEIVFVDKLEFE
ncbi:MAG: OsmC family protein [Syntrophomonadaceae bacterium]